MHNFRQLQIWTESMSLVKSIYLILNDFPATEKFWLISQISRCSISIPSNIAEGSSRSSNKEFAHFLSIPLGSLFELETQLILSVELDFVKETTIDKLMKDIIQLQKKISTFKKTLL